MNGVWSLTGRFGGAESARHGKVFAIKGGPAFPLLSIVVLEAVKKQINVGTG